MVQNTPVTVDCKETYFFVAGSGGSSGGGGGGAGVAAAAVVHCMFTMYRTLKRWHATISLPNSIGQRNMVFVVERNAMRIQQQQQQSTQLQTLRQIKVSEKLRMP